MKRPSMQTLLIGHPVVATPLAFLGGLSLLAWSQTGDGGFGLIGIIVMTAVGAAIKQATAYRAWERQWDAMADSPRRPPVAIGRALGIALIVALGVAAYLAPHEAVYACAYAYVWLTTRPLLLATLGLVGVALLMRQLWRRRRRAPRILPVMVIARRTLPVPTLADAYRALPPYCHTLLRGHA